MGGELFFYVSSHLLCTDFTCLPESHDSRRPSSIYLIQQVLKGEDGSEIKDGWSLIDLSHLNY